MGLDMYLSARKYVSDYGYENGRSASQLNDILDSVGLTRGDLAEEAPSVSVSVNVAYWRKANAIHNWFIENIAGGEDDCRPFHVSRDELVELHNTIKEAMDMRSMQEANPDEALPGPEDILPTQSGFFFGSTEYDEWYWENLEWTENRLATILKDQAFADFDFEYRASW